MSKPEDQTPSPPPIAPDTDTTLAIGGGGVALQTTAQTDESQGQTEDFEFLYTRDIEFRQETLYFIVVDRFRDGDPRNNEGPNPDLYDPDHQDWWKYWGGDLQGVIDKLDYLKEMGVTSVWLTPLFEQVERLVFDKYAAIHGYWTKDFKRINPRYIAPEDNPSLFQTGETVFDRLIAELHKRGMKIIVDIVCNHSSPDAGGVKGRLFDDGNLIADFNDDVNHWYHHYGGVTDWEDEWQVQNCELAGLATFNENNTSYRNYIKAAIKLWLDRGVDALRVDTIKHMPIWFWQEFNADIQTHKPDVFIFGEWIYSSADDARSVDFANNSGMTILDFGLCIAIRQGLALGEGFEVIQDTFNKDHHYDSATELVTFIDNHDMHRFQTLNSDPELLRLAVVLLMTVRGIPCLFYGTEQYLHEDTDGDENPYGNNDPYNRPMMEQWETDTPIYRAMRVLSGLRRLNPAVSLGGHWQKYVSSETYAYMRRYRDSRCMVILNCSNEPIVLDELDTELPDREHTCVLTRRKYDVVDGKLLKLELEPKDAIVISHVGERVQGQIIARVQLNGLATAPGEQVVVVGDCPELGGWDINQAYPLEYVNPNNWFAEIPFNESAGRAIAYKYAVIYPDASGNVTRLPAYENLVCRRWLLATEGVVKWRDRWAP